MFALHLILWCHGVDVAVVVGDDVPEVVGVVVVVGEVVGVVEIDVVGVEDSVVVGLVVCDVVPVLVTVVVAQTANGPHHRGDSCDCRGFKKAMVLSPS